MKIGMKRERGITLIALVVTIVVLLILAGVSINALFGNNGIIEKAKEAQNKMDKATENDQKEINELTNWLDNQVNGTTGGGTTGGDANPSTTPKISTLVGTVVDKNTKAEDAYGNKITIPKGFKVVAHGTVAGSATYTYSGDNIPAVQDGIVIENGTDGNQFVWVPVGTIKNKNNTTNTITLGRYSSFTATNGVYTPAQVASVENCTQEVTINTYFKELSTFRENCPDVRNTKVIDIIKTLKEYNLNITIYDPWANPEEVKHEYGVEVVNELPKEKFDTAILAVAHKEFATLNIQTLLNQTHVIFDVKSFLPKEMVDGRL
jgi:flagellar basal body-associated protein FliL